MAGRLTARERRKMAAGAIAAVLLTAVMIGSPARSASAQPASPQPAGGQSPLQTRLGRSEAAAVEKHIATLHRELRITPLQEPLWQALTAAMRDNVVQLDSVYARRRQQYGSMSAVEDLKSYGVVQQVHARNVQSLIGPFQNLYDSFSDSQKKTADETLRTFTDNAVRDQH